MSSPYRDPPPGYGGDELGPRLALPTVTPVVKVLLIVNGLVFAAQFLLSFLGGAQQVMLQIFGLAPQVWARFFPFVPPWQLFTYGFLHSTRDAWHLLWNMLLLYFFGTMLEAIVGSRRFLVTYAAALLAGALLHLVAEFSLGSLHPAIGASGAVLGVLVAAAVLRPNTQVIVLFIPVTLKWMAIGIVALDVFQLLNSLKGMDDFVAHYVHLGGAVYGFLAARQGWIWRDPIQGFEARRAMAREAKRRGEDRRMDELLAKIHDQGLNALSRGEKEFLKRMSDRGR